MISLKKYPHPYKCALSICSDIDRCSFADFIDIHRFLNTTEKTAYGPGLGLEIGDSFWMYSAGSKTDDAFSYFEGLTAKRSGFANCIAEGIRAGYIDTLHSFGHFSQFGGFKRALAEQAIHELRQQDLDISVWVNHGSLHNFQNIGSDSLGDLAKIVQASSDSTPVSEYHTDLTIPYGIRYLWIGPKNTTAIIGQDRCFAFPDYLSAATASSGMLGPIRALRHLRNSSNHLYHPTKLRDGKCAFEFNRYLASMCWGEDFGDDLRHSLTEATLSRLIKNRGSMIIYNHMGKKRQKEVFSSQTIESLRRLKNHRDAGAIWVTTTARLLRFSENRDAIEWQAKRQNQTWQIIIKGYHDRLTGTTRPARPKDLEGLSFETSDAKNTEIIFADGSICQNVNRQQAGCISVELPPLSPENWKTLYQEDFHERTANGIQ